MNSLQPGVLVADQPGDLSIERAVLPGVAVTGFPASSDQSHTVTSLIDAVRRHPVPVLIVWSGGVFDRAALEQLASMGVHGIVCASVGYNHVDLIAATALGIVVCNVPDYGTEEVADHTLSFLLWSLRKLGLSAPTAAAADTFWSNRTVPVRRLSECTVALLGFGRIGQAVARRAEAFGMHVRWYDPYVPRGQEKVTRTSRAESLPELLRDADILSIHCLLNNETRGLVNAGTIAMLPAHAVLINTARGPIVNESDLLEALQEQRLGGAALDVLEQEPPGDTPLFRAYLRGELPGVIISPHVAWYSEASAVERKRKAAAEAGRLVRGESPFNPLRP